MAFVDWQEAVAKLKHEEVVALPTETVYGLAGRIDSEIALHKIFKTKGRPFFDPLIVHVTDFKMAHDLGTWDSMSEHLAHCYWPGPLTIVLPKSNQINALITSGGPTVALRAPNHPLFQKVLKTLNIPLAAPSANLFGQTSPTTAEHVEQEFSGSVPVVDGGECENGIESTVVQWDDHTQTLKILRPGAIPLKDLEKCVVAKKPSAHVEWEETKINRAPGFLANHYQPKVPFFLVFTDTTINQELIEKLTTLSQQKPLQWTLPEDASLAARMIYRDLRSFTQKQQSIYLQLTQHQQLSPDWVALRDRLQKACHFLVTLSAGNPAITKKEI